MFDTSKCFTAVRSLSACHLATCHPYRPRVTRRYGALRDACEAHGKQLQRVLTGQGIDRHLLGLYIASQMRGEAPAIFSDKARSESPKQIAEHKSPMSPPAPLPPQAFKLSGGGGNFVLSTSNVGYTALFGGFAPMVADGYGAWRSLISTFATAPQSRSSQVAIT